MMNLSTTCRSIGVRMLLGALVASGLVASGLGVATPSVAAETDLEIIQSYVGNWRGRGTMKNGDRPEETVVCRIEISPGNTIEKIVYHGRCSLAGATLNVGGTLAYIIDKNRYEAVMTTNTSFKGVAIGHRSGNDVTYNLRAADEEGRASNVNADFNLQNGVIALKFEITEGNGNEIVANVPFQRRG